VVKFAEWKVPERCAALTRAEPNVEAVPGRGLELSGLPGLVVADHDVVTHNI